MCDAGHSAQFYHLLKDGSSMPRHFTCMVLEWRKLMTRVSDFETILGDTTITVGDASNPNGWIVNFSTTDCNNDLAYLTFMVRGITTANRTAEVFVNTVKQGDLFSNEGGDTNQWGLQIVTVAGGTLSSNNPNVISVLPAPSASGNPPNEFDDFEFRNVHCHFHKDV
jgi:hypothetical protein